jgi:hypothetical protein
MDAAEHDGALRRAYLWEAAGGKCGEEASIW